MPYLVLLNFNFDDKSVVNNVNGCINEFVNINEQFAKNKIQFVKNRKEFLISVSFYMALPSLDLSSQELDKLCSHQLHN